MPFSRFDRYVDRHARAFTERLQALCRMPSVAARGTGMRAMSEEVEQLLTRAAIESAPDVYGARPIIYPFDPSSGPVGTVCGVRDPPTPVASFGTSYAGSNPHGPDENIRLDDFMQSIKFFGRIIHYLGHHDKPKSGGRNANAWSSDKLANAARSVMM